MNYNADIIGLSGLITPSLEIMTDVARQLQKNGFTVPLLIGGATTSKVHTAVKIEPHYNAPVIHVKDASKSVGVVSSLLSHDQQKEFMQQTKKEYEALRKSYSGVKSQTPYVSLEEARKNGLSIDWNKIPDPKPSFTGIKVYDDFPLAEIRNYISWVFFFIVWQLRGKYPDLLDDPKIGEEARKLFDDANRLLDRIIKDKLLTAHGVAGIFPANSIGDDIEVYADETRKKVIATFFNLRNQEKKSDGSPNLCLADFIAPRSTGIPDYLGAFAVTTGLGIEKILADFERNMDDYHGIMTKALADRLAEAFTELLHEKVRKEIWGYVPQESLSLDDMLLERYQGIRPAHGYPACPDHTEKETLFRLLNAEKLTGITLTESFSMYPAASVSGLLFAHPQSRYFYVGNISSDQVEDYARRKKVSPEQVESWLPVNLNYK